MRRPLAALLFLILTFLSSGAAVAAMEVIHEFESDIVIHPDSTMTVTETIRVTAAGKQIKRGIYRDFPTTYTTAMGETMHVGFEVVSVLRNGQREPWHTDLQLNGTRVYIGRKGKHIPHGEHTYTLVYNTSRQVGYFDDYDELYWNVTGNGWAFPIEKARAILHLPAGAHVLQMDAYTGLQGARGKDYRSEEYLNRVEFETTRTLMAKEGFTVAVGWPKGFVTEPEGLEKLQFYFEDNNLSPGLLIMLALLVGYYILAWNAVGRDPQKGTIIPLFHPPKGFSPAAAQFVLNMGFSSSRGADNAFAAALMNMAVKGVVGIREDDGTFTVEKKSDEVSALSRGEKAIFKHLLGRVKTMELKQVNHPFIGKAFEKFKNSVRQEFEGIYFLTNRKFFYVGIFLTLMFLLVLVWNAREPAAAGFMCVWLTGWTVGVFVLLSSVYLSVKKGKILTAVGTALFSIPFIAGEVFGFFMLLQASSLASVVLLALVLFINFLFYELLKVPTACGRDVMDKIEGFKMFLSVAEQDRFEKLHPPEITPELFEQYLPYALALGVENEWSEKFAETLSATQNVRDYQPAWYSGHSFHNHGAAGFAGALGGGLSSAISSSSTAPGSSSGGGGGGSSGGGGGGGGGGGW